MTELDAYLPMEMRVALTQATPLPDRAQGVVLFVDVSGSTRLTAALAQELGPRRGAEELMRQLNQLFTILIAQVHRYGGSVTGFSGDAITCWFEQRGPWQAEVAGRATTAALAMQAALTTFPAITTPTGATFTLGIKVALVAGPVRRFVIGNSTIQRLASLAGATMNRLGWAEQQAKTGEVVVGAEIVTHLVKQLRVKEWRLAPNREHFAVAAQMVTPATPAPWPEMPQLAAAVARPWLLPPVFDRVQARHGDFLGELRPVVALFLKFSGIDYDDDDAAGDKLDRYITWVQTTLARYEGYLMHVSMGDKGSYLNAAFGALVAHEDDPSRAIAAALALQTPPAELHFLQPVQIGIGQELGFVGAYGSPERRTYGILGNEINIAARLMDAAQPGEILITARLANQAERGFVLAASQPITAKGVGGLLTPLAVQGRKPVGRRGLRGQADPDLVGRQAEQTLLQEQLQAVRHGQASCVILEGEAGIGKSRLIQELLAQSQALRCFCLVGTGHAIESATAYFAWRPIFRNLLGIEQLESLDAAQAQLVALWANQPDRLERLPLLNVVTGLHFADTAFTSQLIGVTRAENTRDLLLEILLERLADTEGAVLVLDDAHWLDSASWALVKSVSQQGSALLLVLAMRPLPPPWPEEYSYLRALPSTHLLVLTALPPAQITALICQRLGVTALPAVVEEVLRNKAEGHPFFSEELAYALRDTGLLRIVDGRCELTVATDVWQTLEFPNTIQAVITSRIDRLPPNQQLLLKVASVIGRVFAVRTLHDVHPVAVSKEELLQQIWATNQLDLTTLATPEPELAYLFRHLITQEVTYQLLLYTQRQELHRAVAEWYEQTYRDLTSYYPTLAHHWEQAGVTEKALTYLEKAGEQAFHAHADREVTIFFSRALQLASHPSRPRGESRPRQHPRPEQQRQARWHYYLGRSQVRLGLIRESQQHLDEALRLLGYAVPVAHWQWGAKILYELGRQGWHLLRGQTEQQEQTAEDEIRKLVAQTYAWGGGAYLIKAQTLPMIGSWLAALNEAELAAPSHELAMATANMVNVAGTLSLHKLARHYVQRVTTLVATINHPVTTTAALTRICRYLVEIGEWRRCDTILAEAARAADRLHDRNQKVEVLTLHALSLYYQGQYAQCIELCLAVTTLSQQSGVAVQGRWGIQRLVLSYLRLGHFDLAIDQAEQMLGQSQGTLAEDVSFTVLAHSILSVAHCCQGKSQVAYQQLQTGVALLGRSSFRRIDGQLSVILLGEACLTYLAQPGVPHVTQVMGFVKEICKRLGQPFYLVTVNQPAAWICQGKYQALSGRPKQAERYWQKALQTAERLGLPLEQAAAHYELGYLKTVTVASTRV